MAQVNHTAVLYAYLSGTWTALDDIQPTNLEWGMNGNKPTDRLADIGDLSFALDNSAGLYTPGGPSALVGWKKGIPVKLVLTYESEEYVRFRGAVEDIDIKPNVKDKKAYVSCVDWLDYAARHPLINPGIQTNQRGNQVLTWVMNNIAIPPLQYDFDTGRETFPTAFDTVTSKTKAYNEFAKVAFSELGYVYVRKDKTGGEILIFESADARHGWRAVGEIPLSVAESNTMIYEDSDIMLYEDGDIMIYNESQSYTFGLSSGIALEDFEAPYGDHVINRLTVSANPRRLDASPQALFGLDEELIIASGATRTLKGTYADPAGGLPINGQDMVTPVVTTDYTMFTATGGGGSNISGSLTISIVYGTEGFTAQLTNTNASTGYINFFQTRGTGIYQYNPIEHAATNSESIGEFEYQSESLNQKYKNDFYAAAVWADGQVDEHRQPRVVLNSISFTANKSPAHMLAFLYTDVGDLRYIDIDELGLTGNYYIQGIRVEMNNGIIRVTWIVMAVLSLLTGGGLSALAVEFAGGSATDGINFGYLPKISNLTKRSISFWIYLNAAPIGTSDNVIGIFDDNQGVLIFVSTDKEIGFYSKRTSTVGQWKTPVNSVTAAAWVHVVVTMEQVDVNSDPIIYIDGTLQTLTENLTPSGSLKSEDATPLVIGNWKTATEDYTRAFNGKIFDPRVYDVILSQANVTTLRNGGTPDETLLTDPSTGLIFQTFAVRTEKLADYVDDTLTSTMPLRDAVFGSVGTPHGSPIGRSAP